MRSSLAFLATVSLSLVACAQPHPNPGPGQGALDQARTTFEGLSPGYVFQRAEACNCTDERTAAMRIEVVNREIASAFYVEGGEVPAYVVANLMTIDQTFDAIQDAIDDDLPLEVTYDAEYGYPTTLFIDRVPEAADDELSLTMSNFGLLND